MIQNEDNLMTANLFEKWAAFLFLTAIFGLVVFLTYVPLPTASENIILLLIGGLMSSAATALPRLFGERFEEEKLRNRVLDLEQELALIKASHSALQTQHDRLMSLLVERHIVKMNYEVNPSAGGQ